MNTSAHISNHKKILIGFSGKIGSGKDEAASFSAKELKKRYDLKTSIKFLADAVKKGVVGFTGCDPSDPYTREGKEKYIEAWGMTVGQLLQKLGEMMRNEFYSDIWVNTLLDQFRNSDESWIIGDVRYPNEVERIHDMGGFVIRVNRSEDETKNILGSRDPLHISETGLDDYDSFDAVIDNNGTLDDLYRKLSEQIELILQDHLLAHREEFVTLMYSNSKESEKQLIDAEERGLIPKDCFREGIITTSFLRNRFYLFQHLIIKYGVDQTRKEIVNWVQNVTLAKGNKQENVENGKLFSITSFDYLYSDGVLVHKEWVVYAFKADRKDLVQHLFHLGRKRMEYLDGRVYYPIWREIETNTSNDIDWKHFAMAVKDLLMGNE